MVEPRYRDTAAPILATAFHFNKLDPDCLLLFCPSDHYLPDTDAFQKIVYKAASAARSGSIVLFGVQPNRPETGYGYIEITGSGLENLFDVKSFEEKPSDVRATEMMESGNFLWNAGIFLSTPRKLLASFQKRQSDMYTNVCSSYDLAMEDLNFLRLEESHWERCENISIDYALIETETELKCIPLDIEWSDLGTWESVWRMSAKGQDDMVVSGNTTFIDCANSILRSEGSDQVLVGIGLDNITAIAMPDAVLVADKSRSQDIKKAVSFLKSNDFIQAESLPRDHRPWGWFEILLENVGYKVKRLHVYPGRKLSLQNHQFRSEHWVVVKGDALVTLGQTEKKLAVGQSIYIPLGEIHRLENIGKDDLVLIEVQTGSYLGEDDITRFEDDYSRK